MSFAPLAFKLFYAARQNAVLRRSHFPSLIGTRGAIETFLDGRKGRAAKNSVLSSGAKQLKLTVRGTQALLIGTRGAIETFLHWPSSRRATSEQGSCVIFCVSYEALVRDNDKERDKSAAHRKARQSDRQHQRHRRDRRWKSGRKIRSSLVLSTAGVTQLASRRVREDRQY